MIVGSATLKSSLPFVSSYVTAIPFSVLLLTIAPTMSSTRSATKLTAPEDTEKSVLLNEAIPLLLAVASSADIVTAAVSDPLPVTSIPSPAAMVAM